MHTSHEILRDQRTRSAAGWRFAGYALATIALFVTGRLFERHEPHLVRGQRSAATILQAFQSGELGPGKIVHGKPFATAGVRDQTTGVTYRVRMWAASDLMVVEFNKDGVPFAVLVGAGTGADNTMQTRTGWLYADPDLLREHIEVESAARASR